MQISITDYKNNEIFDIVILSWEINIPTINKTAMFETWMYILKQHLIDYENDKKNIIELINNKWEAKNIIDDWINTQKLNDLQAQ